MANFKRIPVIINAATGKQIDEFGSVVHDNDFFRLLFDETVILCCQFYDVSWIDGEAQLSEHPIDSDLTLSAFGDNDFDYLTSFMFLSEQTEEDNNMVNIANDWFNNVTADPARGQLSFRIDTNTTRFAEALNSSGLQNFYFCITGVPSGQTAKTVLAYFCFKAENRPSSSAGAPVSGDPGYLNSQEVQALVKSAPVFEFSLDGETSWHDTQVSADKYYREQRNGGEWSEAIALVVGPAGADGIDGIDGIGVAPQGAYASGTTYALDDGVTYDGSYYRSLIADNTGNQPDSSPEQWELMIEKGETGAQGEQGIQGIQGEQGIQGIQGETGAQGIQGETGAAGADGADGTSITVKGSDTYSNIIAKTGAAAGDLWISTTTNSAPAVEIGDGFVSDGADNWTNIGAIQGPRGEQGIQGTQGIQGATGPQGEQGIQGETGATGADGADAPEVQIEFSVDGSTSWHSTFASGDKYQKVSTDGGSTWSAGIKFVGEDGGGITQSQAVEIALIYG
jgi:hypothetical protein